MATSLRVGFCVDVTRSDSLIGWEKFIRRLALAMQQQGAILDAQRPDVYLYVPWKRPHPRAKVNVVRMDGLWMGPGLKHWWENRKIVRRAKNAHGVVFQVGFAQRAYERYLNFRPRHWRCIANGADPAEFLPRRPSSFFLANTAWRPGKRLKELLEAFVLADRQGLDADLVVTGQPDMRLEHPRIRYVGWQSAAQINQWLSQAMALLHLTWCDCCPNAMVESLVAGCPVIHTDSGGQGELGQGSGPVITDTDWDYRPVDRAHAPPIDVQAIAQAMWSIKREPVTVDRSDLHIHRIAQAYLDFYGQLLSSCA